MEIGSQVKVKKNSRLPKLASQFQLQEGEVTEVKEILGRLLYRVRFSEGEAMYQEHELEEIQDGDNHAGD